MNEPRFAIYFAPEPGTALADFGWPWLGRRPESLDDAPFHRAVASDARHAAIIATARVYGLHATLKAPFHLKDGCTRTELVAALEAFAASRRAFTTEPLILGEIAGFLALRLRLSSEAVNELAAACVTAFDRFRAPARPEETKKRVAQGLSPRQHELLDRWGYPYVLDEFRFHMTLTDRLADDERARVIERLVPLLDRVHAERVTFGSLCLFEQRAPTARFVITERISFPVAD